MINQVLIETILQKLETLEISLLKENNAGNDESLQQELLKKRVAEINKIISVRNCGNYYFRTENNK